MTILIHGFKHFRKLTVFHKKAVESEIDVRKFDKPILLQTLKPENKEGTQNSNPEEKLQNLKKHDMDGLLTKNQEEIPLNEWIPRGEILNRP